MLVMGIWLFHWFLGGFKGMVNYYLLSGLLNHFNIYEISELLFSFLGYSSEIQVIYAS